MNTIPYFGCVSSDQIFSWDVSTGAYDEGSSDGTTPRAFISVLSEMIHDSDTCEGAADDDAGEGRMDSE